MDIITGVETKPKYEGLDLIEKLKITRSCFDPKIKLHELKREFVQELCNQLDDAITALQNVGNYKFKKQP